MNSRCVASTYHRRGGDGALGRLEIHGNPAAFYRELVTTVGLALGGYGVLTLLICALIAYILKRDLERPLRHIAGFVTRLTPGEADPAIDARSAWQSISATRSISSPTAFASCRRASTITSGTLTCSWPSAPRNSSGPWPRSTHFAARPADRLLQSPFLR